MILMIDYNVKDLESKSICIDDVSMVRHVTSYNLSYIATPFLCRASLLEVYCVM